MLIPYIEFELVEEEHRLHIPEVWVGPTPHKELALAAVHNFLSSKQLSSYRVAVSTTPYRTW